MRPMSGAAVSVELAVAGRSLATNGFVRNELRSVLCNNPAFRAATSNQPGSRNQTKASAVAEAFGKESPRRALQDLSLELLVGIPSPCLSWLADSRSCEVCFRQENTDAYVSETGSLDKLSLTNQVFRKPDPHLRIRFEAFRRPDAGVQAGLQGRIWHERIPGRLQHGGRQRLGLARSSRGSSDRRDGHLHNSAPP